MGPRPTSVGRTNDRKSSIVISLPVVSPPHKFLSRADHLCKQASKQASHLTPRFPHPQKKLPNPCDTTIHPSIHPSRQPQPFPIPALKKKRLFFSFHFISFHPKNIIVRSDPINQVIQMSDEMKRNETKLFDARGGKKKKTHAVWFSYGM